MFACMYVGVCVYACRYVCVLIIKCDKCRGQGHSFSCARTTPAGSVPAPALPLSSVCSKPSLERTQVTGWMPMAPSLKEYCMRVQLFSHVQLCDPMDYSPPGTSVHRISQARILAWLPFPTPGDIPDPCIEPVFPAMQADSLPLSHVGPCRHV